MINIRLRFFFYGILFTILCLAAFWFAAYKLAGRPANKVAAQAWLKNQAGKVMLITGTSSGIGKEIARQALGYGIQLFMVDRKEEGSKELLELAKSLGVQADFLKVDLTDIPQRQTVVPKALERFKRIDFLVNNAAYGYVAQTVNVDIKAAKNQFEVNFWAYVALAKAVIPAMQAAGGGYIVNMASIMGTHTDALPYPAGFYAASKHAVYGWSKTLEKELSGTNIRVKIISPGGVDTPIFDNMLGPDRAHVVNYAEFFRFSYDSPEFIATATLESLAEDDIVFYPGQGRFLRTYFNLNCLLVGRECPF